MTRTPQKTCPSLYRLMDRADVPLILDFLGQDEFRRQTWLEQYRIDPGMQECRKLLGGMLHKEKKERLEPLDREAARVLTVSEPRGQYTLDGLAQAKLRPEQHAEFKLQKDDLARSLWIYLNQRLLFDAAESALHHQLYRRYAKHYQSFQAIPVQDGSDVRSREAVDRMIADVEARLDRGSGCTVERFALPAAGDHPASEMYIVYHPNPLTSAREVQENGERRTIYFRPPGEATIVFTPSTGVIEVRADTRVVRQQVAESFAANVLVQDLSSKPLDHREYDLSRFFDRLALDCPEVDGFAIRRARVIKAEVSLRHLGNRLSLATSIDEDIEDLIAAHSGLSNVFRRAVAIRFVDIAVRYVPAGEAAEKTLDFSISDHNTCSLLSLDDERERILGHRLLRHWGILREVCSPSQLETWRTLPVCLDIWDAGFDHVSGSWLRSRGIEASMLTKCGFLEPAGWEETSLIEEDDVGLTDSKVIAGGGRSHLSVSDGQVSDGGPAARYRRFSVDQGWLIEHLRSAISSALDRPYIEPLDDDLFGLGRLMVDGTEVPVYLARRLDDEKVLAASDTLLRSRGDQGLGIVLDAGSSAYRCVGANVLSKLVCHLTEGADGPALNVESMRIAFRSNRYLARGGQTVELIWDGGETGELFVSESGSIQIKGHNRLIVVDRLVKAFKSGARVMKTQDLNHDLGGVALRNIFGPSLWSRLEDKFIRSAGHGYWEIAA